MDCEYRRKYTDMAARDLENAVRYISEELGNPDAARRVMAEIRKCTANLCAFPSSGVAVSGIYRSDMVVRKKVVGNYVLFYGVDKTKKIIWMLRIVYGARNMDEIFKTLNS
mgnify:CR=1 FL=1